MPKNKKIELVTRAIKEFFFMYPDCLRDGDLDQVLISRNKEVYRVEAVFNGKSYIYFTTL